MAGGERSEEGQEGGVVGEVGELEVGVDGGLEVSVMKSSGKL